jgi:hypothetical protein
MFSILVDRERRSGEAGFCERANRYGDALFSTLDREVHGGAAGRAEIESCLTAFIAHADVLRRLSLHLNNFSSKPRLSTKDAARPTLAREAVADRDSHGIGTHDRSEPARCCSIGHGVRRDVRASFSKNPSPRPDLKLEQR